MLGFFEGGFVRQTLRHRILAGVALLSAVTLAADPSRVHVNEGSDARAVEIAQATVTAMGGWDAFDATRFVSWNFFGRRQHHWDRQSGDLRIEWTRDGVHNVILINVRTKHGLAFRDGELLEGDAAARALESGDQVWINDSYWMFMPYKMLDPGVTLKYIGEKTTADGSEAWVLDLTFADVGYTPENRYHVYVGKRSGLVEQWDFYAEASNEEPDFSSPWKDWRTFGEIKLATNHGRDRNWKIAVHKTLPETIFSDPSPVKP